MKVAFVLFCAFALAAGARVPRDEKYSTKYDNIDLDSILKNDRLLQNYVNCLLDKGTCTPEGTDLKSKFFFLFFLNVLLVKETIKIFFFVWLRSKLNRMY